MPHANPKFWFALLSLFLMVSGFLLQQATKLPFVERLISGEASGARRGFDALLSKSAKAGRDIGFGGSLDGRPAISEAYPGFAELSGLIAARAKADDRRGRISRIIDSCSLVPDDRRGFANLVVVEWEHGVKTQTSYEEIRELIAKKYDDTIRPLQYWLFCIGLFGAIGMFKLTYFPKPTAQVVKAETKKDDDCSEKTEYGNPAKKE